MTQHFIGDILKESMSATENGKELAVGAGNSLYQLQNFLVIIVHHVLYHTSTGALC